MEFRRSKSATSNEFRSGQIGDWGGDYGIDMVFGLETRLESAFTL